MLKDKIKKSKLITDKSNIINPKESDLTQCPKCLKLSHSNKHECNLDWHSCSICGIDLRKNKPRIIGGIKYYPLSFKKYFRIISSMICYNCAIKIARMVKKDTP